MLGLLNSHTSAGLVPADAQAFSGNGCASYVNTDLLDIETYKGLWFLVNYTVQSQLDVIKRRLPATMRPTSGAWIWIRRRRSPFLTFMYKSYWRVETTGMDNVPYEGRGLLSANHSGTLPWDGAMIGTAIYHEHPMNRLVRSLYATWFPTVPFVSEVLMKGGQVLANVDNGTRLLEQNHLVAVFPEGYKGVSKLFKERYQLARFGRGGFVRMALASQAPIIPVSVVGAEETYVVLHKSRTIAKLIGFPVLPDFDHLAVARPAGFHPAADQMVHRLRHADPDRSVRPGRGEQPGARLATHGSGAQRRAGDDLRRA